MVQTNTIQGHNAGSAYVGVIVEVIAGTYVTPTNAEPASNSGTTVRGGAKELEALLGNRYKNLTVITDVQELGGSCDGPFVNGSLLLAAAMKGGPAGTDGSLFQTSHSIELGLGLTDMIKARGALIDTFTIRGALGSAVAYTMAFKCLGLLPGTVGTAPTLAAVKAIGCVGVGFTIGTLGGGSGPGGSGRGFEITINNNVKSEGKYGQITPAYIFSGGYGVTGKLTVVLDGAPLVPDQTLGNVVIDLQDDLATPGTLKHYTMTNCRITDAGQAVKVGNLTMQDVSFIASAEAGAPLAIT